METRKFETHGQKVEMVMVHELVPYDKNPKKHGANVDEIVKAVEKHGESEGTAY